jgi:predicted TIM-barrel fold metal-dependent hydrolase
LLRLGGAAVAGAVLGIGGWEGAHYLARPGPAPNDGGDNHEAPGPIIDAHVHVADTRLPGVPASPFQRSVEETAQAIRSQLEAAGVAHALAMPARPTDDDPLGVARTRAVARLVPNLHPVAFADPERIDDKHLGQVDEALSVKPRDVAAFKAYLGYLHHGADSPNYRPYYRLAAKHGIPVIFHTGDNYSQKAKVKFAHPLLIDEVAVDFPETKFVIAHMGNPWLMDAAEVIYKNNWKEGVENVWADLSAFVIGSAEDFEKYRKEGVLKSVIENVRKALEFAERPDRILFGSDWPLAPIATYRDFIRDLVPPKDHRAVFYENANKLFQLA